MKALEVNQTFDTRQLPSHLDCYSMLAGGPASPLPGNL